MSDIASSEQLLGKLKRTLFYKRIVAGFAGLLGVVAIVLSAWTILSLVAYASVLPVAAKVTLLVLSALGALYFFGTLTIRRFFGGSVDSIALELEDKHPEIKGRLIAAIQFARMKDDPGYSRELVALTHRQAWEKAGQINFSEILSYHPILRTGRYFLSALGVTVLLLFVMPGLFSHAFNVYSKPTEVVAPPLGYQLVAQPGNSQWIRYKDIPIGAALFGEKLPKDAVVHHRFVGGTWQKTPVSLTREPSLATLHGDSLSFFVTLKQINKSFDYYVEAGKVKTEVQKIDVVDRPRVNDINLSIFYPKYTKLPPATLAENNGSFSALVGSKVNLNVTTNLPVQTAQLIFADSSRLPLNVNNTEAEGSLMVEKSQSYYIKLLDQLGETNPDPIEYYITAVPDEYPSVEALYPGFDANLGDEMILPLRLRIFDDFGFTSLVLKYVVVSQGRPSQENVAVLHFSDKIETEGEVEFNWDMDRLNLFPGDFVSYYLEVADNDVISGPKVSRTRQYIARLPSLDEIIAQTEAESSQRITKTESLMKSGKELSDRLKNISRKLQAQQMDGVKEDWQNTKELEAIAQKNAELVQEIEKVAQEMDKSLEQLNDKALLSREILEKMAEIQKLFEEVATPEMKEAQQKLMDALKSMDKDKLEKALKDFQMSQQELLDRLDRTMALLKKMQLEQKMEAMIRQIEELAERQAKMNEETDKASKEQLPSMSEEEKAIQEAFEKLKSDTEELDRMAREAQMENQSEFQKFKEAMEKTDAEKNMQQMAQSMNKQEKEQSQGEGKQAHSKMMEMLDQMQQQLMAMKGQQDEAFEKEMRMAIDDANYLSNDQERLLKEAASSQAQAELIREFARNQQDLMSACSGLQNRIGEMAKSSPFIASELEQLLNQTTANMELAMQEFDAARAQQALRNQREAMVTLNKASLRLMESLNQQKQCNQGGSCNKNTSQLESLSQQQNQLNQQTQSQCQNPGSQAGESGPEREAMQRLAAEQGSIRKSLEELNREFGGSRQILGRLDDIAREMKDVEEALASGTPGQEVVERQLKIFSRMLEASRSLYRKDFTEQRQAKTAVGSEIFFPDQLSPELFGDKTKLEDRLRQYLGDNYPRQYEEQIKAYFKALLQVESTPADVNPAAGGQQEISPSK